MTPDGGNNATGGKSWTPGTPNPAWVSAGPKQMGTPGYKPQVGLSPFTGWRTSTGALLKKKSKTKKKASVKKPKIIIDNKLRGAYAESDLDKGTIRINKKRHKEKGYQRINPTKNGDENMTSTLKHELLHFKHPGMSERNIRKLEKKDWKTMSSKEKKKLQAKLK